MNPDDNSNIAIEITLGTHISKRTLQLTWSLTCVVHSWHLFVTHSKIVILCGSQITLFYTFASLSWMVHSPNLFYTFESRKSIYSQDENLKMKSWRTHCQLKSLQYYYYDNLTNTTHIVIENAASEVGMTLNNSIVLRVALLIIIQHQNIITRSSCPVLQRTVISEIIQKCFPLPIWTSTFCIPSSIWRGPKRIEFAPKGTTLIPLE